MCWSADAPLLCRCDGVGACMARWLTPQWPATHPSINSREQVVLLLKATGAGCLAGLQGDARPSGQRNLACTTPRSRASAHTGCLAEACTHTHAAQPGALSRSPSRRRALHPWTRPRSHARHRSGAALRASRTLIHDSTQRCCAQAAPSLARWAVCQRQRSRTRPPRVAKPGRWDPAPRHQQRRSASLSTPSAPQQHLVRVGRAEQTQRSAPRAHRSRRDRRCLHLLST